MRVLAERQRHGLFHSGSLAAALLLAQNAMLDKMIHHIIIRVASTNYYSWLSYFVFERCVVPACHCPPIPTTVVDGIGCHGVLLLCMQVYTESTDGSYLDVKESALVWHYKDADPDFGRWQAKVCCAVLPLQTSLTLRHWD